MAHVSTGEFLLFFFNYPCLILPIYTCHSFWTKDGRFPQLFSDLAWVIPMFPVPLMSTL